MTGRPQRSDVAEAGTRLAVALERMAPIASNALVVMDAMERIARASSRLSEGRSTQSSLNLGAGERRSRAVFMLAVFLVGLWVGVLAAHDPRRPAAGLDEAVDPEG